MSGALGSFVPPGWTTWKELLRLVRGSPQRGSLCSEEIRRSDICDRGVSLSWGPETRRTSGPNFLGTGGQANAFGKSPPHRRSPLSSWWGYQHLADGGHCGDPASNLRGHPLYEFLEVRMRRAGMSLVEALVAAAILAVSMGALLTMNSQESRGVAFTGRRFYALMQLAELRESMAGKPMYFYVDNAFPSDPAAFTALHSTLIEDHPLLLHCEPCTVCRPGLVMCFAAERPSFKSCERSNSGCWDRRWIRFASKSRKKRSPLFPICLQPVGNVHFPLYATRYAKTGMEAWATGDLRGDLPNS
jgi:hypothetical protein